MTDPQPASTRQQSTFLAAGLILTVVFWTMIMVAFALSHKHRTVYTDMGFAGVWMAPLAVIAWVLFGVEVENYEKRAEHARDFQRQHHYHIDSFLATTEAIERTKAVVLIAKREMPTLDVSNVEAFAKSVVEQYGSANATQQMAHWVQSVERSVRQNESQARQIAAAQSMPGDGPKTWTMNLPTGGTIAFPDRDDHQSWARHDGRPGRWTDPYADPESSWRTTPTVEWPKGHGGGLIPVRRVDDIYQ